MTVLIDTNVLFDVLGKRAPHYVPANQLLLQCRRRQTVGLVALHSVADVWYHFEAPALPFLRDRLLPSVSVVGASSEAIQAALALGFTDFEDALVSAAAAQHKARFILTRNRKHFRNSRVPALAPADYLSRFH